MGCDIPFLMGCGYPVPNIPKMAQDCAPILDGGEILFSIILFSIWFNKFHGNIPNRLFDFYKSFDMGIYKSASASVRMGCICLPTPLYMGSNILQK